MSNGTQINVVTNTVEIRNVHNRIDIVAPNTGTAVAVTQPTTRVVQVNVPGPQGVQGQDGSSADISALNTFTGSIQTQVNSLTAATSSYVLNAITSSMLLPYVLSANTSSFVTNAQTSSMLQPYVLNSATSSFVTNAVTASMLQPYVLNDSTGSFVTNAVTSSMLQPYVLSANTSSFVTNAQTSSMTVLSASFANTASYIDPTFISASAAAAGFGQGSTTSETDPIFVAKSASLATTGSNTFTGNQYVIGSVTASLFKGDTEGTASWSRNALTASTVTTLNQNVTIVGNLQVFGSASYNYVTASQLDVGTEWISVNVAEPAERFGGLKVYDSGSLSHQATASLAWDSLRNHWVYQNASGSGYSGGMLISGPRNTGSLGDEPELNRWFVTRGDGDDHINSTQIFSSGSTHQITGSLTITNNLTVSNSIDSQNHYLKDSSGYFSVEWNGRILRDSAQLSSIDWGNRILYDSSNNTSIDWQNRTLTAANNSGVKWDDYVFYPVDDDTVDLGIGPTNRFRRAYFARDVFTDGAFIGNLTGTASVATTANLADSSSVTTVVRGGTSPSYMVTVAGFEPTPRHEALLAYQSVFVSASFGAERLHANSMVAPSGFTGSLEGTASWARNANTASFASTASFTPNAITTASVSLNTITFTKGDGSTFPITVNTGSSSPASAITQSFRLQSTAFTVAGASGNRFAPVSVFANTASETAVQLHTEHPMVLKQLIVRTTNSQPATGNFVIALRKNGADTSLLITIPSSSVASVFSASVDVSLATGDLIAYRLNNAASTTSANVAQVSLLYST